VNLEIRRARPDEARALTRLAYAAKRHWGYPEAWIRRWRADLSVSARRIAREPYFCAVSRRRRVGFYGLSSDGAEFELEHMWVRPSHIGQGVGRALFQHALATVRSRRGATLKIASDPNAEPFYRIMGARRVGTVPSAPEGRRLPLLRVTVPRRQD
jgi:GNAT superfamily N-acetyltransferase